ncbi:acyltransferase [Exiguobacterium sp. R-39]|uniref:acyltransferase n=1 Tax=Exiguobacterium sp. R-39 TaxID=3416708 RepID=UPI003CEC97F0
MIDKISFVVKQKLRDMIINSIASSYFMPLIVRKKIYNIFGIKTYTKAIRPNCYFGGNNIEIGKGTTVNGGCYFENLEKIKIGKNCDIAMEVLFCTSTHELGASNKRAGKPYGQSIYIGDGCWIGARVTILPGVIVGNGCVIGAGSLVTKDCEPNSLYLGSPAKKIKELN